MDDVCHLFKLWLQNLIAKLKYLCYVDMLIVEHEHICTRSNVLFAVVNSVLCCTRGKNPKKKSTHTQPLSTTITTTSYNITRHTFLYN